MKITKRQLRKHIQSQLLKEWVPAKIANSPQVMSADAEKQTLVSAPPSKNGGYLLRFDDNQLGSGGIQKFTYKHKESETSESLWEKTKGLIDKIPGSGWLPNFFNPSKIERIAIPEKCEETIEADLMSPDVLWSRSLFYLTDESNDDKVESLKAYESGIDISVVGTFISNPRGFDDDPDAAKRQFHTVILNEDVEKFVNACVAMLRPPFYRADVVRVANIIEFLSGDSRQLSEIFGTELSLFSNLVTKFKRQANVILGSKFDENSFQRESGTRIMCVASLSDTAKIYDAVEYFNQRFAEKKKNFLNFYPEYDNAVFGSTDYVEPIMRRDLDPGNTVTGVSRFFMLRYDKEIKSAERVIQAWSGVDIDTSTKSKKGDAFIKLIETNKEIIKRTKELLKDLAEDSDRRGFNKTDAAAPINAFSRSRIRINENRNAKQKRLLKEALTPVQIDKIVTDWLEKMKTAQNTGGLATEPAGDQTSKMLFFTSENGGDDPVKSEPMSTPNSPSVTVNSFFIGCLKEFDVIKVVEENVGGQIKKTLKIKSYEDIAFFIQYDNGSYLNPLAWPAFYTDIVNGFKEYLGGFQEITEYQIEDQTRVTGEEPQEREEIDCPDYSKKGPDSIKQIEVIINKYLKSIGSTEKFTEDGQWNPNEDSAWAAMVNHTLGNDGKHPAKGKINASQVAGVSWLDASKDLKAKGFKGYTPNYKGILAFAYDAYTDGENVDCGWKRPLSSGGSGGGGNKKAEEPKQAAGLPKKTGADLKVNFTGKLANNENLQQIEKDIRSAVVNALPTGKKVNADTSLKINTGIGGRVQGINSKLQGVNQTGLKNQIKKFIPKLKNTKGTIDVTIPKGNYSLNENTTLEFVKLLREMIKREC